MADSLTIVGAGLAGCEAAWQASRRGRPVRLLEMRPDRPTAAHSGGLFAELVCSNSFRSDDPHTAVGALKNEMRALGSLVMSVADEARVPAGRALAVDRVAFAEKMTARVTSLPGVTVERREIIDLPAGDLIVATGPLTSPPLVEALQNLFGATALSFYDAIAPIVDAGTLTPDSYFACSRYDDDGDYLNVPLTEEEYGNFISALATAEIRAHLPEEKERNFFEGCLPIEEMARRGPETPRFGPMKPVGLTDPRTGRRPFAVIQLRKEDLSGRLYNLVGFQTQLAQPDQERIFRMLPAFSKATFIRYGSAHRNTFIDAPRILRPDLAARVRPDMRLAGQMAGVEGYVESTACGLMAGLFASIPNLSPPPPTTVIGGLLRYITSTPTTPFQPMKANWGVVDEIRGPKSEKKKLLMERSAAAIREYVASMDTARTT